MSKKKIKTINENRLFKLLPYFFDDPLRSLLEIVQNACRSGATRLDIRVFGNKLEVIDDGQGTDDVEVILTLADSKWEEDVEENQNPAGWGLFFLMSISEKITYKSRFGSITIDCNRFLSDGIYRENIMGSLIPEDKTDKGFYISAVLKEGVSEKISNVYPLGFFPLDIIFNGVRVEKKRLKDLFKWNIETSYMGNPVYINLNNFTFWSHPRLICTWYGLTIPLVRTENIFYEIAIEVVKGSPLTPVLPYRDSIKYDDKYEAFYEFVRKEVVNYCVNYINNQLSKDRYELIDKMKILTEIATQEEVDALERYYVSEKQPYYYEDVDDILSEDVIVEKINPVVISDEINKAIVIKDKNNIELGLLEEVDNLLVPKDVIKTVSLPQLYPSWLKKEDRQLSIEIEVKEYKNIEISESFFEWYKAERINCGGNDLRILALVEYFGSGKVFYVDKPNSVYDISDLIFNKVYNDDGDTYDTQRDYFDKNLQRDVDKISGTLSIYDLLGGLSEYGFNLREILTINIIPPVLGKENEGRMILKTIKGDKIIGIRY